MSWLFHIAPTIWILIATTSIFFLFTKKEEMKKIFYLHLPVVFTGCLIFLFFLTPYILTDPQSPENIKLITNGVVKVLAQTFFYYGVLGFCGIAVSLFKKQKWLFLASCIHPLYMGLVVLIHNFLHFEWGSNIFFLQQPTSFIIVIVSGFIIWKQKKQLKGNIEHSLEKPPSL